MTHRHSMKCSTVDYKRMWHGGAATMETPDSIYESANTFWWRALAICLSCPRVRACEVPEQWHNVGLPKQYGPSYVLESFAWCVSESSLGISVFGLHTYAQQNGFVTIRNSQFIWQESASPHIEWCRNTSSREFVMLPQTDLYLKQHRELQCTMEKMCKRIQKRRTGIQNIFRSKRNKRKVNIFLAQRITQRQHDMLHGRHLK